ncbi:MAG: hypothetical protein V4660_06095 [Pseudomonadota bacterium]
MIELSGKIFEAVQSENVLWLAVFLVVATFMNASKIFDFLENRKKTQIKRLQEVATCTSLDENFKEFITHEIQREYFLYIARIAAEKQYRDRLFEIHKNSKGNLPFFHFRRASGFIKYQDGDVIVKITAFDKFSFVFNAFGSILFIFLGWAFFMTPLFSKPTSIIQAFSFAGAGLAFLAVAMLLASQSIPFHSAKRVRAEIEKQVSKTNQIES